MGQRSNEMHCLPNNLELCSSFAASGLIIKIILLIRMTRLCIQPLLLQMFEKSFKFIENIQELYCPIAVNLNLLATG